MLTLKLGKAQISVLNYERYHYPDAPVQKRFHVIYFKATQPTFSCEKIGAIVSFNRRTVSECILLYSQTGIDSLKYNNYGTNQSKLETKFSTILGEFTTQPVSCLSNAKARIKDLTGIERSLSSVRTFLKKHQFKFQKIGHIPTKADPEKQAAFLEQNLNLIIEKAKKSELSLLFLDSAHFVMGAFLGYLWSIARVFIPSPSGKQRLNVIGAIDAITKKLYFQHNTTYVNAIVLMKSLAYLRQELGDIPIVIVLDNARCQHYKAVIELSENIGITLLFLPPYSPNLNIIERLMEIY